MKKILFLISFTISVVFAQEHLTYQKPPKEILDLVDIERAPSISIDSKNENILFSYRKMYKDLNDLSQEEIKLGGLRVNPTYLISSTYNFVNNLRFRKFYGKDLIEIKNLPQNLKAAYISWSPDENYISFCNATEAGLELWLIDVKNASAKKYNNIILNGTMGNPVTWKNDSKSMLVKAIVEKRNLISQKEIMPVGPTVSVSEKGVKAQNRTYQDLLKNRIDEDNFDILIQSTLIELDLVGNQKVWREKDAYMSYEYSPDGKYILVNRMERPYSYIVPYYRFPMRQEVYTSEGKLVKEVNFVPLTETLPKGFMATRTGKRSLSWRNDLAASLYYVEALDGGDPEKNVDYRDELFSWQAPFNSTPVSLMKTKQRFSNVLWGNENVAIVSDDWWNTRNTKTYIFSPKSGQASVKTLYDRSSDDKYTDPGNFEMKKNEFGTYVIQIEKNEAFLIGDGFTAKGQFPFLDALNLSSLKTKRLYKSTKTTEKENIIKILDLKKGDILLALESATKYPNYYVSNIRSKKGASQITFNKNPFESIANIHKEVIKYKRADGIELSGTLYLPANYNKKDKLPLIMWAYPQEYKDKNSAGQVTQNPNEFTFPYYGSPIYWVTRGYAILDDAAFPIVGEGNTEPNDSFIEQLIANAQAAISHLDKLGYIDPKKVAIGGHSYGAFMTANLLTHSNLFACGVARSGAYNRTLTPFGFQSEERSYWDAPEIYNTMSPFMTADKMKNPLLLIHGEADNNPGTFTLQSERYFHALKGLGNPARLVLLPKESHGYAAIENILHVLWEQDQWFEKYLK